MMGNGKSSLAFWQPRRGVSRALVGVVGGLGVIATSCDRVVPECRNETCERMPINVLTWWPSATPSGSDQRLTIAAEEDPLVTDATLLKEGPKAKMVERLEAQMPSALPSNSSDGQLEPNEYDAFLANGGRDVLRWTACRGGGGAEDLVRLDERFPDVDWQAAFSPAVRTGLECCPPGSDCVTPGIYAVPLGLHRVNHIIYNSARFAECEHESVASVDLLVELLRCLGAGSKPVISMPLTHCDASCVDNPADCSTCKDISGQSLLYLLESLLLLESGDATQYQSYWHDEAWNAASPEGAPRADPLRAALDVLRDRVAPFLNGCGPECARESAPSDFTAALKRLANGDAAFMVIPDWLSYSAHEELQEAAFPGTEKFFLFTSDVFAVPANANIEAGLRWVDTLLRLDVQEAFAEDKPARQALGPARDGDVPSLEALLPSTLDIATLRARLNDWMREDFQPEPALVGSLADESAQAEHERTSPRCNGEPCSQ
jgi:hypothetical protein